MRTKGGLDAADGDARESELLLPGPPAWPAPRIPQAQAQAQAQARSHAQAQARALALKVEQEAQVLEDIDFAFYEKEDAVRTVAGCAEWCDGVVLQS